MTLPLEVTEERLNDQLNWYDKKAQQNKTWYNFFTISTIILALAVTVITCIFHDPIVAVLSALIALGQMLKAHYQNEYNWLNYRSTAESLKHEKFLFESHAGPYADTERPEKMLAERIEGIISHEHASWISVQQSKEHRH